MKRILRTVICAVLVGLSACSSTTFESTWKSPDAQPVNPQNKSVAALVISSDKKRRRDAEIYLAHELTVRGARGVAAYTLIGIDLPNVDVARERFKEAGVDGVVIMRLVAHDSQTIVDPGGFSGSAYTTFGSYYQSYGMSLTYSTGSVQTDEWLTIETLIYSLNQDKLLWAGTSRTTNPEGLQGLITEVANAVSRQVAKQGVVAR
ncbi:MAG: hypothetical protein JO158_10890 [Gammaproteobacteria bacterium]|nr:hypothetical protein [Gammaproteobacteria bacterium]MBV9724225.1 hypothetical protein [Gammaproteobacteria bacterium]